IVVLLLFLTAIGGLIVTLLEDFGPNSSGEEISAVYYTNPVLFTVTWVKILVLLCQEGVRRKERAVDSASLFLFWLLLVLCDIFPFQTLLREALKQHGGEGLQKTPGSGGHVGAERGGKHRLHQPAFRSSHAVRVGSSSDPISKKVEG
ncbi:hypothetical protein GOODEAATRI_034231, partial [Goodea atripinnis]